MYTLKPNPERPEDYTLYIGDEVAGWIHTDCKGPNPRCRTAHRAGRTFHVNARTYPDREALVMGTYHYATVEDALAALEDAVTNAPTIHTDEELYAARAAGIAYKLRVGWVDPERRR